jgi:ABC-type transporter Mla subunit MlaD
MNQESAITLLAIAVAISSISLLVHALASVGLYRAIRRLESDVRPLIPQAAATLESAQKTLTEALAQIKELSDKAHGVLDTSKANLDALSATRDELTGRLRAQAERLELVLDDTLSRVHDVVGVVHSGVMTPVREVSGVLSGIRTAFQTFVRGRRPSVDRATHDEEMFI